MNYRIIEIVSNSGASINPPASHHFTGIDLHKMQQKWKTLTHWSTTC